MGTRAVGLYATFTYVVVRRSAEFGVRMALGAAGGDILRLVLGDAARVLVAVVVVGLSALAASAWPARRAARVDPSVALRSE